LSLTNLLLNNSDIKALFSTIPNLKTTFRSIDGSDAFPKNPQIIVKSDVRANAILGTAYDYFLRAYVQRINGIQQEVCGDHLNASITVNILRSDYRGLSDIYNSIIGRRNTYITGNCPLNEVIIRDSLMLGRLEHYYRSGEVHDRGLLYVSNADIADLYRLAQATFANAQLFMAKQSIVCNPTFGNAITRLVGGADGDLILDEMLIDIKCESAYKWQIKHLRQLIGYWILSCLTPEFKPEVKRLGIWNPRYQRLVFIDVEDICRAINMEEFTERFIELLSRPDFDATSEKNGEEEFRHLVSVLNQVWTSRDQIIRQHYC
jgi:hypothetical protein